MDNNCFTSFLHTGFPVTLLIMLVIFITSTLALVKRKLFMQLILHPYSVYKEKEIYRLFTADLVHNDLLHLVINEISLYFICANLEENLNQKSGHGSLQFALIYLMSYFAGVIFTTIRHKDDFTYSTAGASGSILGCMMSFMIIKPNYVAVYLPVIGNLPNKYAALIYILMLIWYQRKTRNELINHEVHFLGAIGGIVATFILFPGVF